MFGNWIKNENETVLDAVRKLIANDFKFSTKLSDEFEKVFIKDDRVISFQAQGDFVGRITACTIADYASFKDNLPIVNTIGEAMSPPRCKDADGRDSKGNCERQS